MKKAMFLGLLALLFLSIPHPSQARDPLKGQDYRNMYGYQYGFLESPAPDAVVSGIGFISGWRCGGTNIRVNIVGRQFDGHQSLPVSLGVSRADTHRLCNGHDKSGFIMQFNWNNLDAGEHEVVAYDEGKEFARHTFTVGHSGKEFWKGLAFDLEVPDFPREGDTGLFVWNESTQHLELAEVYPREEPPLFEPTDLTPLEFLLERSQWTIEVPDAEEWQIISAQRHPTRTQGDLLIPAPARIEFFQYIRGATPWREYPAVPSPTVEIVGWVQGWTFSGGVRKPGLPHILELGGVLDVLPAQTALELGVLDDRYALVIPVERLANTVPGGHPKKKDFCYVLVFNLVRRTADGGMETRAYMTTTDRTPRSTQYASQCVAPYTPLKSTRLIIR